MQDETKRKQKKNHKKNRNKRHNRMQKELRIEEERDAYQEAASGGRRIAGVSAKGRMRW